MATRVRPVAVVVVAALMAINGVAALVALVPQISGSVSNRVPVGALVLNALFGVALLFIAWGLVALKPWAWTTTVAIQAVSGVSGIVTLFRAPQLWPAAALDIVLAVLVIFLLTRPRVRAAFGRLLGPSP
jgi:hypothetical protein